MQASQEDDPFEAVFSKRGEVQKASGSKKVVSTHLILILSQADSNPMLMLRLIPNFQSHAGADADASYSPLILMLMQWFLLLLLCHLCNVPASHLILGTCEPYSL